MRSRFASVDEVDEWPLRVEDCTVRGAAVSAPYRGEAYFEALAGTRPSSTLRASVARAGQTTLVTPYKRAVTALTAGVWHVVVRDRSTGDGFRLRGPGVNRKTSDRFRGTAIWSVTLRPGVYRYGQGPRQTFSVLAAGE
jgi:hypothetical protein